MRKIHGIDSKVPASVKRAYHARMKREYKERLEAIRAPRLVKEYVREHGLDDGIVYAKVERGKVRTSNFPEGQQFSVDHGVVTELEHATKEVI